MYPKSGNAKPQRNSISFWWFAPISTIPISVSFVNESKVNGTPMWLFKLPTVALVLYFLLKTT